MKRPFRNTISEDAADLGEFTILFAGAGPREKETIRRTSSGPSCSEDPLGLGDFSILFAGTDAKILKGRRTRR